LGGCARVRAARHPASYCDNGRKGSERPTDAPFSDLDLALLRRSNSCANANAGAAPRGSSSTVCKLIDSNSDGGRNKLTDRHIGPYLSEIGKGPRSDEPEEGSAPLVAGPGDAPVPRSPGPLSRLVPDLERGKQPNKMISTVGCEDRWFEGDRVHDPDPDTVTDGAAPSASLARGHAAPRLQPSQPP